MKFVLPKLFPAANAALGETHDGAEQVRVFLPEYDFGFAKLAVTVAVAQAVAGAAVLVVDGAAGPWEYQTKKLVKSCGGRWNANVAEFPGGGLLSLGLERLPVARFGLVVAVEAERLPDAPAVGAARRVTVGRVPAREHWTTAGLEACAVHRLSGVEAATWLGDDAGLAEAKADKAGLTPAAFARRWLAQPTVQLSAAVKYLEWCKRYFPHYLTAAPSALHEELGVVLGEFHLTRGQRINRVGPRGAAKSTIISMSYPVFCICEQLEDYIIQLSDTTEQAILNLATVKDELENNERLREDYPDATGKGPIWNDAVIETRNGIRVEAMGTGKKIRGRRFGKHRPTLIICDDLENEDHIFSETRRTKSKSWFNRAVMKAGSARTNVLVAGTVLHRDCLVWTLKSTPGWDTKVWPSILKWPKRLDLWAAWAELLHDVTKESKEALAVAKKYYTDNKEEMDDGAKVLWPEVEPLYALMLQREIDGRHAFETEKQSKPANPEANEWDEAHFGEWIWFDTWPPAYQIKVVALDPSKGKDAKRGDYSAIVSVGVGENGQLYIEADMKRRDTTLMCDTFVERCYNFKPDMAGVEANQFQELLAPDIEDSGKRIGYTVPLYLLNNTVSKLVRIRRLTPFLTQRKLRFKRNSPATLQLVEQMRDFPNGDHDDGPDALEMAIRLAHQGLTGAASTDDGVDKAIERAMR